MTDFHSLSVALADCFEMQLYAMPKELRQRLQGGFLGEQLAADWDTSKPDKRRRLAIIWDYLHDPDPVVTTRSEWLEMEFCDLPETLRQSIETEFIEGRWDHHSRDERDKILQRFDYKSDSINQRRDFPILLERFENLMTKAEKLFKGPDHEYILVKQSNVAIEVGDSDAPLCEESGSIIFRGIQIEFTNNIRSKKHLSAVMNILSLWPDACEALSKRKPLSKLTQKNIAIQVKDLLEVSGKDIAQDYSTIVSWRRELIRKNPHLKKDLQAIFGQPSPPPENKIDVVPNWLILQS